MRLSVIALLALSLNIFITTAQEKQVSENPFDKLGYDPLVATSSRGEFAEFHDHADIVEIGSVLFNTKTNEVVKLLREGETTINLSSATTAMSIDPHCERYYWISPYAYCLNNPIRLIDPDGKDVWELDEYGKILKTITHDADGNRLAYDRIDVLDKDGNLKTQTSTFELGTITQETIKDGNNSYNVFTINGDDNAKSVYSTLANADNSTIVEWSHSVFGSENGQKTNHVSTSHIIDTERSAGYLFNKYANMGISLLEHTHNHPYALPAPSGLGYKNRDGTDMGTITNWTDRTESKFGSTPSFYLYDHKKNIRNKYHKGSKVSDFPFIGPQFK